MNDAIDEISFPVEPGEPVAIHATVMIERPSSAMPPALFAIAFLDDSGEQIEGPYPGLNMSYIR